MISNQPNFNPALVKSMQFLAKAKEMQSAQNYPKAHLFHQAAINTCNLNGAAFFSYIRMLLVDLKDVDNAALILSKVPEGLYKSEPNLCHIKALVLIEQERYSESEKILRELSGKLSGVAEADRFLNLGTCLKRQERYQDALDCYLQAQKLGKDGPEFQHSIASAYDQIGETAKALKMFAEAERRFVNHPTLSYEFALCSLRSGYYKQGFRLYTHRWNAPAFGGVKSKMPIPEWDGMKIKRLLVLGEQGVGDQLVFSAFMGYLRSLCDELVATCDRRLMPLFQRRYPEIKFADCQLGLPRNEVETFDAYIQIPDVGLFAADEIPNWNTLVDADLTKVDTIKKRYRSLFGNKTLVAISWRSIRQRFGKMKSIELAELMDIFSVPDVQFINFQYGDVDDELSAFAASHGVEIYNDPEIDAFNDFDAVAAQALAVDLVVSVSNSNFHLAAAVGANAWLMAPAGGALLWYWGNEGDQCDWYPNVKIFRPEKAANWDSVVVNVSKQLKQFLENKSD